MTSADLKEIYEERLAIMTIDGKVSEAQAKTFALKQVRKLQDDYRRFRQASTTMEQRQEVSNVRSYGNGNAPYR